MNDVEEEEKSEEDEDISSSSEKSFDESLNDNDELDK